MKSSNPPALAAWMLEHLLRADRKDALAGDLMEEFRCGRSAGWYWRQVLAAVALACLGELRSHWLGVSVAVLWAVPVPVFDVLLVRKLSESALVSQLWSLPWPYSTIGEMAFNQGCEILYLWSAVAAYVLLSALALGSLTPRRLVRGMWISAAAHIVIFVLILSAIGAIGLGLLYVGCSQFHM